MQTFLPYSDFVKTAKALDYRRLWKQVVEADQIRNTLLGLGKTGWKNHPAVKMWNGYIQCLEVYRDCMMREWLRRGYKTEKTFYSNLQQCEVTNPPWVGDEKFHSRHRANLLRKKYEFYKKLGWTDDPHLAYFWPSLLENNSYVLNEGEKPVILYEMFQ